MQCLCDWEKRQGTGRSQSLPAATRTQSREFGFSRARYGVAEKQQAG